MTTNVWRTISAAIELLTASMPLMSLDAATGVRPALWRAIRASSAVDHIGDFVLAAHVGATAIVTVLTEATRPTARVGPGVSQVKSDLSNVLKVFHDLNVDKQ
jgi:hypothetical protein